MCVMCVCVCECGWCVGVGGVGVWCGWCVGVGGVCGCVQCVCGGCGGCISQIGWVLVLYVLVRVKMFLAWRL